MTAPRIVVTGVIPEPGLHLLRPLGTLVAPPSAGWTRAEVLAAVVGADAVVTLLTTAVDDELLDAAGPGLKIVANVAVGYNNIDVAACARRGVTVTNTPGVLTEATADIALALILMTTRRLGEGERVIRSGEPWQWSMFYLLGTGIQGQTLGIVGLGAIGQAVARRARAFGMDIVYSNRTRLAPEVEAELGARPLPLSELLATSDVVSLHCPYSPATHHLMNRDTIALMRPTAFLINTARGPVVEEAALANALQMGELAGAGLDVFENEPEVHPRLLACENAVLIPHLGSATVETRNAMATLAARNVVRVLADQPALTPVLPRS
jgi:glyoxylate reductase